MKKVEPRHVILSVDTLLDSWVKVQRVHYQQTMRDGSVVQLDREVSSRGDGVTTLLYHPGRETVLLLRQPRWFLRSCIRSRLCMPIISAPTQRLRPAH